MVVSHQLRYSRYSAEDNKHRSQKPRTIHCPNQTGKRTIVVRCFIPARVTRNNRTQPKVKKHIVTWKNNPNAVWKNEKLILIEALTSREQDKMTKK